MCNGSAGWKCCSSRTIPTDAELCVRALKKHNLANKLDWVKDGAEALDFLFVTGVYASRVIGTR